MNEIACKQMCLSLRNGIEIWLDEARIENLRKMLAAPNAPQFMTLPDQQLINRSDIVGVFSPQSMETLTERKNGVWRCKLNKTHDKGERCDCLTKEEKSKLDRQKAAIQKCTNGCQEGYVATDEGMVMCSCLSKLETNE